MKIKEYKLTDLISAEYNPRQLTQEAYQALRDSIQRFGLVDPILININPNRKNVIIGGHQRAKIAEVLDMKKVPCVELDLTLEQEKELNIRLNKNVGSWDFDILGNMFEVDELLSWGFSKQELSLDSESIPPTDLSDSITDIWEVVIECKSEKEQEEAFENLQEEGYTCRLLTF